MLECGTMYTGADYFADCLLEKGIKKVFVYPGGTIAPLFNACLSRGIEIYCLNSEQGSGYAALASAKISKKPSVLLVTSGPGVTNALTPLADCFYDSIPLILVTGQIGTPDLKKRKGVRQRGFQEVPTVSVVRDICKEAACIDSKDKILNIHKLINICDQGRKGPVVIDFPMDMQREECSIKPSAFSNNEIKQNKEFNFEEIFKKLNQSNKRLVLLGNGAHSIGQKKLTSFIEKIDAEVVTSFPGLGSFDCNSSRNYGYIGHTGNKSANTILHNCDFLFVLGSRLDIRQTGTETSDFAKNAYKVWVDIDKNELDNPRVEINHSLNLDVSEFIDIFLDNFVPDLEPQDIEWLNEADSIRLEGVEDKHVKSKLGQLSPKDVLKIVDNYVGSQTVNVVTGVGNHQHWAGRHISYGPTHKKIFTSSGHGTMGYDLPAAIGCCIEDSKSKTLCIVGDGSLLMNIQELGYVKNNNLNLKILVMNNSRLGIVSQFQMITWGTDPTTGNFSSNNFSEIAKGFGIKSQKIETLKELESSLDDFWKNDGPYLLDVSIDKKADLTPMLLGGQKMDEMWDGGY